MRFKGYDCAYTDDHTWAMYEEYARTKNGFLSDHDYWSNMPLYIMRGVHRYLEHRCEFRIAQWAYFEITFGLEADYFFGKQKLWSQDLRFVEK